MTGRQRYSGGNLGQSERGSTLVLVTLFIFVLFGFTALSIDVANVYRQKHKAQDATDAAALAGVAQVGDPSVSAGQQASAAITEADVIANTNGVTDAEIVSGAVSNTGTIEVGMWDGVTFTPNGTFNNVYNAVRVPAQRTVPLSFGRVVGVSQMTPTVHSVADIGATPIPYGIPSCYVTGVGGTNTLQNWHNVPCSSSSGNWGVLDLCGPLGPNDVEGAISGPGCFSSIGESTGTKTGVPNKTCTGFQDLWNNGPHIVVLPVTTDFPTGVSADVTVLDYVVVQLLGAPNCNGNNFSIDVQILGRGLNDLKKFGLGPVRALVE